MSNPGLVRWFGRMPGLRAGAGICARRRTFFSCVAKKRRQKKATPSLRPLRFATGQTCVGAVAGCAVELALLLRSAARTATASQITKHARSDARAHPATAPTQAQPAGGGQPNIQTSARAVAALGPATTAPSARRLRPRRRAERSDGPCGLRVFNPLLAAPAAGCLRGGMRAPARMLRELTRRVCPNGAPQARSELCGEPRKRPAPGLPRSEAQGSQTEGRLSFAYFSLAKQRKVSRPPGRDPASAPRKSTKLAI